MEPDLDRVRAFVALAPWKFAATMADVPHEYAVRKHYVAAGGTDAEFTWLVGHIYEAGWPGRWRYLRNRYVTVEHDGIAWQLWCMGWKPEQTLIVNRARRDDPVSRAIPCGPLSPCRAITQKGEPCRNMAEYPRKHCPVHARYPHLSEPEALRQLELFSVDWWSKDDEEDER